jgi:hypothetical protein
MGAGVRVQWATCVAAAVLLAACGWGERQNPEAQTPGEGPVAEVPPTDGTIPPEPQAEPDTRGPRKLNQMGEADFPQLATSGRHVFLAWLELLPDGPAVQFQRSADEGATFTPVQRLSPPGARAWRPSLVADGSHVYVLWEAEDATGQSRVWMRVSTDLGATFGPEAQLPVGGREAVSAGGGQLYVAWWQRTSVYGDASELLLQASADSGQTWGPMQDLNQDTEWGDFALTARGDEVWLLWDDDGSSPNRPRPHLRRSVDRGQAWDPILSPSDGASTEGQTLLMQGERLHLAWSECESRNNDARCRAVLRTLPGAGQPLGPKRVFGPAEAEGYIRSGPVHLAADGEALHLLWQERGPAGSRAVYQRSLDGGKTFLEEQRLLPAPGERDESRVDAAAGRVYFTWQVHEPLQTSLHILMGSEKGAVLEEPEVLRLAHHTFPFSLRTVASPSHLHVVWLEGGDSSAAEIHYLRR